VAFSPDGKTLMGSDHQGSLLLWDVQTGKVRTRMEHPGRRTTGQAFSPDGKVLAVALGDPSGREHEPGVVVLWDTVTGKERERLTGHADEVLAVAFAEDGRTLLTVGRDQTLRRWDVSELSAAR
jgi:WD40 repeat protein